jgi:hypothetical protein
MSQNSLFDPGTSSDIIALNVIRSETVLSRLPIHNLSKQGKINIEIKKRNERGAVELLWEVSYNERYGQPRQLAYKLDTLIINRRIEEAGRPLPKAVRMGSLREICKELDMSEGETTNQIKKAIHQNAGAYITAKMNYTGNDGVERTLEAGFTRYSVIFTGEKLPDGRRADAVYLILNEPYREVLNNAPVRPLDYDYLKMLTPAAQRCYEIISYRIFAAIKYKHPHARLPYSEYCMYSAQQRYHEFDRVKKQMYKVHRPHLQSHYLAKVWLEETADDNGNKDWMIYYVPGARARAEYAAFARKGQTIEFTPEDAVAESGAARTGLRAFSSKSKTHTKSSQKNTEINGTLLRELIERGVTETKARKLLAHLPPGQFVLDQLDWGDDLIRRASPGTYRNPPGFYIYLIQNNVIVPDGFGTRRKKELWRAAQEEHDLSQSKQAEMETAYMEHVNGMLDQYINETLSAAERDKLFEAKRRELAKQFPYISSWSEEQVRDVIQCAVRSALYDKVDVPSFEEFCSRRSAD